MEAYQKQDEDRWDTHSKHEEKKVGGDDGEY
jgi:hypothetical protein